MLPADPLAGAGGGGGASANAGSTNEVGQPRLLVKVLTPVAPVLAVAVAIVSEPKAPVPSS